MLGGALQGAFPGYLFSNFCFSMGVSAVLFRGLYDLFFVVFFGGLLRSLSYCRRAGSRRWRYRSGLWNVSGIRTYNGWYFYGLASDRARYDGNGYRRGCRESPRRTTLAFYFLGGCYTNCGNGCEWRLVNEAGRQPSFYVSCLYGRVNGCRYGSHHGVFVNCCFWRQTRVFLIYVEVGRGFLR